MNQYQPSPRQLRHRLAENTEGTEIPVPISYDIIRLFSEGLYQSPHKAVEELVANSFDAGAQLVSVVLPSADPVDVEDQVLWVVDDGCGMDDDGFRQLWLVAESNKASGNEQHGRSPIGQFGIGKLAAYVLAWQLTHISKSAAGEFRFANMNFRTVTGRQSDPKSDPAKVHLHSISEADARVLLSRIEELDPHMWGRLFGPDSSPTWTAAALSDFRELVDKLQEGRLGWVLRTGLPLISNFTIHLNATRLEPSKTQGEVLHTIEVGGTDDRAAIDLNLSTTASGVKIAGIGSVTGKARIFKDELTRGKSLEYGRSNGFFVRVRGRVINLDDELFGLNAMNHSAWAHFIMEIDADGLRDHLLSSREGVRDSEPIRDLRRYMHKSFNACRAFYDNHAKTQLDDIEIDSILERDISPVLVAPLLAAIRSDLHDGGPAFNYIQTPEIDDAAVDSWLAETDERLRQQTFADFEVVRDEPQGQLCRYDSATGIMYLNKDHPFGSRIVANAKGSSPARLLTASEIMTYALVRSSGLSGYEVHEIFRQRDHILRRLAGEQPMDVAAVLRHLQIANADPLAMERAVGRGFEIIGFDYEPLGGAGRPDGIIRARLGRGLDDTLDYSVVYDAKTSDSTGIAANKVNVQAIVEFADSMSAEYGLVVGHSFEAENDAAGALNRRIDSVAERGDKVTVLRTIDLITLVRLHYRFGLTFPELRDLFESAHTVPETKDWVKRLQERLEAKQELPLGELLRALEKEKQHDENSRPHLNAARANHAPLKLHNPERLKSALEAIAQLLGERWLSVEDDGYVRMDQSAAEVIRELDRRLADDLQIEIHALIADT